MFEMLIFNDFLNHFNKTVLNKIILNIVRFAINQRIIFRKLA